MLRNWARGPSTRDRSQESVGREGRVPSISMPWSSLQQCWSIVFLQEYTACLCAAEVRQHNSCVAYQPNGGNEITTPGTPNERTVAVVPPKESTAQSRACPREGKSHGRYSLKAPKRQVSLDTQQNDQPEAGSIGPGSVCNEIFNAASPLYQLVPRSSSRGNRCISPRMEDGARICPSPLVPYSMGPMQSANGRSYSGSILVSKLMNFM